MAYQSSGAPSHAGRCEQALEGLTVVELGTRVGIAVAGSVLAQLGATVVFVEAGSSGCGEGKQRFREQLAAGKLSIVPDFASDTERDLLRELVRACDVLLVSSDVDSSAHRDLASPDVADGAIVCDLTAFGSTGPLSGRPYSDIEIQALSGVLDCTGMPDRAPTPIDFLVVERLAGIYAAGAVLCAIRQKRTQGLAQCAEISLYDVAFSAMTSFLAPAFCGTAGSGATRVGNRHTMAAPWNVFKASDGWVLLCAGSDDQWRRICELIGRHDLAASAGFAKNADRVARVAEVDAVVQGWVERHTVGECVRRFGELGIPCGRVVAIDGHPREDNLDYRRMIFDARDGASGREVKVPGSPLRMTRSPGVALLRIPAPDADRLEVSRLARSPRSFANRTPTEARPALDGVRIVEIGHYTTVPVATRCLAAVGAEVIKLEPPEGEAVRNWPPARNGQGVFFTFQNSDKKSVTVDLDSEEGRAQLGRLVASADVLVENLRPGALAKRGFSPEEVSRMNPRLVYCSISGFGADSLYGARAAFDTVIQAMSGLMDVSHIDGMPLKTGPSFADIMGAAMGFVAMIAALEFRDRANEGQYVDLSMQDISAWATQTLWNHHERLPQRFDILKCRDGYILADRACLAALPGAAAAGTGSLEREAAVANLERLGVHAVPVLTIGEVVEAPQTRSRNLWFFAQAGGGSFPLLSVPLRLARTPPKVCRPAPALGRDNDEILRAHI